MSGKGEAKWLQSKTREELKNTLGWGDPPKVRNRVILSAHHPLIPRRYVPPWQTDMENRRIIIENCKRANNPVWRGHISYFLNGRERLDVTSYKLHEGVLNYSRNLHRNASHLSKFNSSLLTMS